MPGFSVVDLIKLFVVLAVLVGSCLYYERYLGDIRDPASGTRLCRRAPDEIAAWSVRTPTRRPEDMERLARWASRHRGDIDRPYEASCSPPLQIAARLGREDAARVLLAHGADVEARDDRGKTPLHEAAAYGEVELVEILLAAAARPDGADEGGTTPLHRASQGFVAPDLEARLAVARRLLAAGADPNPAERSSRMTPLFYAADARGDPALVRLLLDHGARAEAADAQGETPLHRAAFAGDTTSVRLLLDRGADPNAGPRGTPLASAAQGGRLEVARLLIERGADGDRGGESSRLPWKGTPLEVAMMSRAESRSLEIAALLIERGARVDARSADGRTLLHQTAEEGLLDWVRFLLDRGAAVGARDATGATPLHEAVRHARLEVAGLLLDRGADPGAAAADGTTPLALAREDPEMEALLRRRGGR